MSGKDALLFIQRLGERSDLQEKLRSFGDSAALAELVDLAGREGLFFTAEELQTAFVRDWSMRRSFFCGEEIKE